MATSSSAVAHGKRTCVLARVHMNVFHRDLLLTFAAVAVQGIEQRPHRCGKRRRSRSRRVRSSRRFRVEFWNVTIEVRAAEDL